MWQRFTEKARKIVFYAQEEAQKYGHGYVSTEHLLLGLCRESDSVAGQVLDRLGVPVSKLQVQVEQMLEPGEARPSQDITLTPRAKMVIDLAYDEARNLNNNYIGTEHLMLGLMREGDGVAGRALSKAGLTVERTRREVMAIQDQAGPREHPTPATTPAHGAPKTLPAILMVARVLGADLLALMLLTSPSGSLAGTLGMLGQDAGELALDLERRAFSLQPKKVDELPVVANILDSVSSAKSVFGRIARNPNTLTHLMLLELGITAEAIVEAFPE